MFIEIIRAILYISIGISIYIIFDRHMSKKLTQKVIMKDEEKSILAATIIKTEVFNDMLMNSNAVKEILEYTFYHRDEVEDVVSKIKEEE